VGEPDELLAGDIDADARLRALVHVVDTAVDDVDVAAADGLRRAVAEAVDERVAVGQLPDHLEAGEAVAEVEQELIERRAPAVGEAVQQVVRNEVGDLYGVRIVGVDGLDTHLGSEDGQADRAQQAGHLGVAVAHAVVDGDAQRVVELVVVLKDSQPPGERPAAVAGGVGVAGIADLTPRRGGLGKGCVDATARAAEGIG